MWSRQTKTTTFGLSISKPLSHLWPDHHWRLRSQRHFHNSTFSQTTQIDQRPRCTIDGLLLRQPYQDQRIYRLPLHLQVPNGWGLEYMVTTSNNLFLFPQVMSDTTFIANIGGMLGLCIGFSFISLVEVLFFASKFLCGIFLAKE